LASEKNGGSTEQITDKAVIRVILDELDSTLISNETSSRKMLDVIRAIPGADVLAQKVDDFEFEQARTELSKLKEALDTSDSENEVQ